MRAMRKYVVPLLLFSAIGAVVVVVVMINREESRRQKEPPRAQDTNQPDASRDKPGWQSPRNTPTKLSQNVALSELERALGREDLSNARYFRHQVCTQLDDILQSDVLTRNLLAAIRKYGLESKDQKRRDVVLPILRVLQHPEATNMIAGEYFKAQSDDERMMLLEAMSHEYHDPKAASVWAIDRALTADTAEKRYRAFEVIKEFSNRPDIVFKTARAIYDGTTRPEQRGAMMDAISGLGERVEAARDFMRQRLRNPQQDEIQAIAGGMASWGTPRDAAHLEALAIEFPAVGDFLRERAEAIRIAIRERQKGEVTEAEMMAREKARQERERAAMEERKKREGEHGPDDPEGPPPEENPREDG